VTDAERIAQLERRVEVLMMDVGDLRRRLDQVTDDVEENYRYIEEVAMSMVEEEEVPGLWKVVMGRLGL
jgi:hypothetical protein